VGTLLESRRGQPLFLTLQRSHWSFTPGTRAPVWGINGRYMGPTIRVWNGDDVKLIYSNRLTENVAMTIRGLQVPGPLIGGAARMMSPNADWAPVLPIRQSAATLWYQANTPNRMAKQVYNGLAGMWLVEDEVSKNLRNIANRAAAALWATRCWLTACRARMLKCRAAGCACAC